ncbi:MAG: cobalt transporter CbiM [Bryobacteraceae bacterium]
MLDEDLRHSLLMHIPDGYLSPSTCATFYAAAAPFWYVALKRAKRALNTRTVPLVGLFAAFCFVIMMFNLPLPGGTTGHAVGMGMASIVLGPWVSILAISMALLIQALFFGDGGITAFGANSFNMAIVGSIVAYAVYRLVARGAAITSRRRVMAAAIGGYSAINVAALCAAIEFGIQPLLFHNAAGTPLYAPYPLSISIPAMMIGHLTFAGIAELVISAGIVSYLQQADPDLLRLTAPDAPSSEQTQASEPRSFWPASRKLWACLGLALIFTPLGILAVGSAWGEWSAKDFSDASARRQIAATSGNTAPPEHVPSGLKRLSSLWKPPVPAYAPSFIKSPYFGYFISAATGVGLIILLAPFVAWLIARPSKGNRELEAVPSAHSKYRRRRGFTERTTESLLSAMQETLFAESTARLNGLLQACDARVKLAGILALIVSAVAVNRIWSLLTLFAIALLLAALSHVPMALLAKRIWIAVLAFTGVIAFPAIFLVPGTVAFRIPLLRWAATSQGLMSATLLVLRAETAATLALIFVLCTPWNHLLRALRFFKVPASIVVILEMTYRYIYLLLKTSQDMIESRQARRIGYLEPRAQRGLATTMAGVLLDKTLHLSNDVHMAMRARGFRGNVRLLDDPQLKARDWLQLASLLAIASAAVWIGR